LATNHIIFTSKAKSENFSSLSYFLKEGWVSGIRFLI
jgi:hypothetical protein